MPKTSKAAKDKVPRYVVELANKVVERVQALQLRGRRADDECLAYWLGAAAGAETAGDASMARHLVTIGAAVIAGRGYVEVARLARATPIDPPATQADA